MIDRSNLGFGCVALTKHKTVAEATKMLSLTFSEGITHFDTAPLYGQGYSEKILGIFLKGKRSAVTVTTKCGLLPQHASSISPYIMLPLNAIKKRIKTTELKYNNSTDAPAPLKFRPIDLAYVKKSLEVSLKNLKTDYIDYYFLHEALPAFLSDGAKKYLYDAKESGVIKSLGISAGYVNLVNLEEEEITEWECLQYENNKFYNSDFAIKKFETKKHFFHSTLKFLKKANESGNSKSQLAGILLNNACRNNKLGKVLFSTSVIENLRSNLQAFDKVNNMSNSDLKILVDAIY